LRVVRDEFREYEWPEIYNDLLRELKKDIVAKKLDGDRTDMWWTIRKFSLGLLTKEEAGQSTAAVEEDEAKEVSLCLDTATLIWY
jgi:ATP-dependent DNA helicase 2 subunit 2